MNYAGTDFQSGVCSRLRGKLDVPKERFIIYPSLERDADPSMVIGWAGWDHLKQAQALANYYVSMKETEGWREERLRPILAGILELLPWLKQWHNEIDPAYGLWLGDYYEDFVKEEARLMKLTPQDLRRWKPEITAANNKKSRKKRGAADDANP